MWAWGAEGHHPSGQSGSHQTTHHPGPCSADWGAPPSWWGAVSRECEKFLLVWCLWVDSSVAWGHGLFTVRQSEMLPRPDAQSGRCKPQWTVQGWSYHPPRDLSFTASHRPVPHHAHTSTGPGPLAGPPQLLPQPAAHSSLMYRQPNVPHLGFGRRSGVGGQQCSAITWRNYRLLPAVAKR